MGQPAHGSADPILDRLNLARAEGAPGGLIDSLHALGFHRHVLTFLKTAAVLACMACLIPLAVWGGTGKLSHAWHATKSFLLAMAVIVVPVLIAVAFTLIPW